MKSMLLNIRKLESSRWRWQAKKKGIENGTYIRYVIENTYRKMSVYRSLAMLMKINEM